MAPGAHGSRRLPRAAELVTSSPSGTAPAISPSPGSNGICGPSVARRRNPEGSAPFPARSFNTEELAGAAGRRESPVPAARRNRNRGNLRRRRRKGKLIFLLPTFSSTDASSDAVASHSPQHERACKINKLLYIPVKFALWYTFNCIPPRGTRTRLRSPRSRAA